jgi:hypothetical protein
MKPSDDKKKKRANNEDEAEPTRSVVRNIVNGSVITIVMAITTLYALVGDDIRVWIYTVDSDFYFIIGMVISFILFGLELLLKSCIEDEF